MSGVLIEPGDSSDSSDHCVRFGFIVAVLKVSSHNRE